MKILVLLLCSLFFLENPWTNDLEKAKILANSEHKMILLNFSGSDWCIPCIKMKKDIFENQTFKEGLAQKLILMNADFPRLKKNRLAKDDIIKNERFSINTRIVKFILNSEPNSFKIFIQNHSDSFLELLYNMAIGNSYHTIEAYQENLNLLRLQILMINQTQNIEV